MDKLQEMILHWLDDPSRYLKKPNSLTSKTDTINFSEVALNFDSLSCIRKNEFSTDEIVILIFWLAERQKGVCIDGIIHLDHDFKKEGDVFYPNLSLTLNRSDEMDALCLMIYEQDNPKLFDPHDPIGLVTFNQNKSVFVYKGDFKKQIDPIETTFSSGSEKEIYLDAEGDGCYKLVCRFIAKENDSN